MNAAKGGHTDTVNLFLELGADPIQLTTQNNIIQIPTEVRKILATHIKKDLLGTQGTSNNLETIIKRTKALILLARQGSENDKAHYRTAMPETWRALLEWAYGESTIANDPATESSAGGAAAAAEGAGDDVDKTEAQLADLQQGITRLRAVFNESLSTMSTSKRKIRLFSETGKTKPTDALIQSLENALNPAATANKELMIAAEKGENPAITAPLSPGANLNALLGNFTIVNKHGIQIASSTMTEISGSTIQEHQKPPGWTALMRAAHFGHTETVKLLIAKGADVNITNRDGHNALSYAADGGHTETVKLLIAKGADVNITNRDGHNALSYAADGGHTETVKILLGAKAKLTDATKALPSKQYKKIHQIIINARNKPRPKSVAKKEAGPATDHQSKL